MTAILVQVKNTEKYQSKFHKSSFDRMDLIELGLFPTWWFQTRPYASFLPSLPLMLVWAPLKLDSAIIITDEFTAFGV